MNTTNKSLNEVFQTLRDLVKSPGYLYVLLFMIEEDICIPFSQLKEADPQIRLSMKEAAMLVGLYINENNDVLKEPNNIDSLFDLRAKTYQVLDELHWAMNEPLAKEMREAFNRYMGDSKQRFSPNQILAHATHMRETFFYSNEPAYDLEYLFIDSFLKLAHLEDEDIASAVIELEQISQQIGTEASRSSRRLEESEPYITQETMPGLSAVGPSPTMNRGRIPVRGNEPQAAKGRFQETSRLLN